MGRYWIIIPGLLICSAASHAATITCDGTPDTGKTYQLPPVNVVLSANIPDLTLLYSVTNSFTSRSSPKCSGEVNWVMTLTDLPAGTTAINHNGHKIYPTSISGLGISVYNAEPSSATGDRLTVPAWPETRFEYLLKSGGMDNWFSVYLWKIPGDLPTTPGPLQFTGPTLKNMFTPAKAADSITTSTYPSQNGRHLIWSSRQFIGSATLINGTCNMQGGSKTVNMGQFSAGSGGNSRWVAADFNLQCPNAAGYGGSVDRATESGDATNGTQKANNVKNGPLSIKIVPRTSAINATQGIIALDGSGATGYGIQLAWGDAASQGAGTPAKPVQLNTWQGASTINSAYRSTAYPLGNPVISTGADGTIKMAARYIRTSGTVQPGTAKASIEVIASYQ